MGTKLKGLHLYRNDINGSIPSEIGLLTKLKDLYLDGNKLTGSLPNEIDHLTELTTFYLGKNFLTGTLPNQLELLDLSSISLDDQFCKVCSEGLIPESTTTNFTLKGNFSCVDMFTLYSNNLLIIKTGDKL